VPAQDDGPVPFRVRLVSAAGKESVLRIAGWLTPYEAESLAMDARRLGVGTRLEITVPPGTPEPHLRAALRQLGRLGTRGIDLVIRRDEGGAPMSGCSTAGPVQLAFPFGAPDHVRARLLVADDDADMRRLVATLLRQDGYDVVEARDGIESLDRLEPALLTNAARFDAIVSDVQMPGLSGIELLASLRSTPVSIPVVLMTAFGDDDVHRAAETLGAAAILDKPLQPSALRAALAAAIPRHRSADTPVDPSRR